MMQVVTRYCVWRPSNVSVDSARFKHDGFRFICRHDGDQVCVFSRRGHDWTGRVPRIAEAVAKLRVQSAT
jgi:bifunctional non-homologous end joining protein LigD